MNPVLLIPRGPRDGVPGKRPWIAPGSKSVIQPVDYVRHLELNGSLAAKDYHPTSLAQERSKGPGWAMARGSVVSQSFVPGSPPSATRERGNAEQSPSAAEQAAAQSVVPVQVIEGVEIHHNHWTGVDTYIALGHVFESLQEGREHIELIHRARADQRLVGSMTATSASLGGSQPTSLHDVTSLRLSCKGGGVGESSAATAGVHSGKVTELDLPPTSRLESSAVSVTSGPLFDSSDQEAKPQSVPADVYLRVRRRSEAKSLLAFDSALHRNSPDSSLVDQASERDGLAPAKERESLDSMLDGLDELLHPDQKTASTSRAVSLSESAAKPRVPEAKKTAPPPPAWRSAPFPTHAAPETERVRDPSRRIFGEKRALPKTVSFVTGHSKASQVKPGQRPELVPQRPGQARYISMPDTIMLERMRHPHGKEYCSMSNQLLVAHTSLQHKRAQAALLKQEVHQLEKLVVRAAPAAYSRPQVPYGAESAGWNRLAATRPQEPGSRAPADEGANWRSALPLARGTTAFDDQGVDITDSAHSSLWQAATGSTWREVFGSTRYPAQVSEPAASTEDGSAAAQSAATGSASLHEDPGRVLSRGSPAGAAKHGQSPAHRMPPQPSVLQVQDATSRARAGYSIMIRRDDSFSSQRAARWDEAFGPGQTAADVRHAQAPVSDHHLQQDAVQAAIAAATAGGSSSPPRQRGSSVVGAGQTRSANAAASTVLLRAPSSPRLGSAIPLSPAGIRHTRSSSLDAVASLDMGAGSIPGTRAALPRRPSAIEIRQAKDLLVKPTAAMDAIGGLVAASSPSGQTLGSGSFRGASSPRVASAASPPRSPLATEAGSSTF
jgi:hypothetical protein